MLIFTTCSLLMTVEICIPYLSSERIDSKAVFIRSLTTCQHSAQLTAFYLTVKYHQKKNNKRHHKNILAEAFREYYSVVCKDWYSLEAPSAVMLLCAALH